MQLAQPGSQLDRYAVKDVIARSDTCFILRGGGSAHWPGHRHQNAASRSGRRPPVYQRFEREKEICEALDHPAVVKAFPEGKRSRMYIAMEVAPGQLLRQVLSDQRPAERAVKIAVAICDALD